MARIRTIKPEFWQHPKTGAVSRNARLLFLGLLNEADDEGRMRYSARRLAGVVFPFDTDVSPRVFDRWVEELENAQLVVRYEVAKAPYLEVCGFTEHQRVNRPQPSILPVRPHGTVTDDSVNDHGTVTDDARGELEREWKGNRKGNGRSRNARHVVNDHGTHTADAPQAEPDSPALQIFEAWKTSTGKNGRTVFSAKRRRVVTNALKDYPLDDILDAVRGWRKSPFHTGDNKDRKVYNELDLLLRDAQHIEQFRDLERGADATAHVEPESVRKLRELQAMRAEGLVRS